MKIKNLILFFTLHLSCTSLWTDSIPPARDTYQELNKTAPFAVSFGCAMSQTHDSQNTCHPDAISKQLQKLSQKNEPYAYLTDKDHIGYTLRALPNVKCCQCNTEIQPTKLDLQKDKVLISILVHDAAAQKNASKLTLTRCPSCDGQLIEQPRKKITLTPAHQQAMIAQINYLGVKNQIGCTNSDLATYRVSAEASDVLKPNSTEIDPLKIQEQAQFFAQFGNALLFGHHYGNPQAIPDLFEKPQHAEWFANYFVEIIKACPNITHVCPISQPVAFSYRVTRGTLPPFSCNMSQAEYLDNINKAQVLACQKIKEFNPNIKVLMSHQWKPMKPYHSIFSPWYALEKFICYLADRKYNGDFVRIFTPHQDKFDGIALSVYPAIYFNGWIPTGNNCADNFNEQDALDTILQTHQAFPNKPIYIVETGCNTQDPEKKKAFIDMMLHVCKIARDKNVDVRGIYFWSHTNDPEFYSEWNFLPGSTHFSPFDKLDPENSEGSINAGGMYLKEILKP